MRNVAVSASTCCCDATKDKAVGAAKRVKAKTAEATDSVGDAVSAAFNSAGRRSWRVRRKTDQRSRVRARKRLRRVAQAERRAARAQRKAAAAAAALAPLTESAADLVSTNDERQKKPKPLKIVTVAILTGRHLAMIRQVLSRRQTDTAEPRRRGSGTGPSPGQTGLGRRRRCNRRDS